MGQTSNFEKNHYSSWGTSTCISIFVIIIKFHSLRPKLKASRFCLRFIPSFILEVLTNHISYLSFFDIPALAYVRYFTAAFFVAAADDDEVKKKIWNYGHKCQKLRKSQFLSYKFNIFFSQNLTWLKMVPIAPVG